MALQIAQAYGYYQKEMGVEGTGTMVWTCSNNDARGTIFKQLEQEQPIIGDINQTYAIYYLGIQSLPHLKFIINSNKTTADSVIQLGQTGIFELNLFDSLPIEQVKFENLPNMLQQNTANDKGINYCLIDVIYEVRQ